MNEKENLTFEEIFKQNENRTHYHMLKLGINDPYREFLRGRDICDVDSLQEI